MARFEGGGDAAKAPHATSHDISTQLITLLSGVGVTSEHGLDHLFSTVDHLVDAALTHWGPEETSEGHNVGAEHHEAAAGGHEPHPAPVPGHHEASHPAHGHDAAAAHPAHGHEAAHAGHDALGAAAAADHGHPGPGHPETPKPGPHHVHATGFVAR